ncbi:MAG: hypothetical protein JSU01_18310 [Bacteroidetes bacterium]|nr:hypothetical protein [Bacteroidota bacterium]
MKTKKFYKVGILLICMLTARVSFAQIIELPPVIITAKSVVSTKVTDAFKSKFKDAVAPRWYVLDKNYLVKFIMEDQKNSALYGKDGKLIYHLAYGGEKNLPKDYLDMVNNAYPGCKIVTAVRAEQNKRTVWLINVEYKKYYVLTKIESDELEEISRTTNVTAK